MARRIRLTESELTKVIQKIIKEDEELHELESEMKEALGMEIKEGRWKNFWDRFRWLNRKRPRGFTAGGPFWG